MLMLMVTLKKRKSRLDLVIHLYHYIISGVLLYTELVEFYASIYIYRYFKVAKPHS